MDGNKSNTKRKSFLSGGLSFKVGTTKLTNIEDSKPKHNFNTSMNPKM